MTTAIPITQTIPAPPQRPILDLPADRFLTLAYDAPQAVAEAMGLTPP
jgi:hypothetical protein